MCTTWVSWHFVRAPLALSSRGTMATSPAQPRMSSWRSPRAWPIRMPVS